MVIKVTRKNYTKFLLEMVDDAVHAAVNYGTHMDRHGEEEAAEEYEREIAKLHGAIRTIFAQKKTNV